MRYVNQNFQTLIYIIQPAYPPSQVSSILSVSIATFKPSNSR